MSFAWSSQNVADLKSLWIDGLSVREHERKLKHPDWKRMKRPPSDICGESAKHWVVS